MTQQEFTERTGYTPATDEEYQAIEKMYMAAGNMDKDEFCANWKKMHDNPLFRKVYGQLELVSYKYQQLENRINEAFNMVLDKAHEIDYHETLDPIADTLINRKSVIRYKLKHSYDLTDDDKGFMLSIL